MNRTSCVSIGIGRRLDLSDPIVLLFDIDGTLAHRRYVGVDAPMEILAPESHRVGAFVITPRPHVDRLMEFVLLKFKNVGIWSSATAQCIQEALPILLTPEQLDQLVIILDRSYCRPDEKGPNPWSTLKDLTAVHEYFRTSGYDTSDWAIRLVEDSPRKCIAQPESAIIVETFSISTKPDAANSDQSNFQIDDKLLHLQAELEQLRQRYPEETPPSKSQV